MHLRTLLCLALAVSAPSFAASPVAQKPAAAKANPVALKADHSTCSKAVKIQGASHFDGVQSEYTWLRKHYPEHKLVDQTLIQCPKGPADQMRIAKPNGSEETVVVFDLSAVWGKGLEGLE